MMAQEDYFSTDVASVRKLAAEHFAIGNRLEAEIVRAYKNGASLRKIAEVAGMSHEKVRYIVSRF